MIRFGNGEEWVKGSKMLQYTSEGALNNYLDLCTCLDLILHCVARAHTRVPHMHSYSPMISLFALLCIVP